jgi:signal transduction histidine kinase
METLGRMAGGVAHDFNNLLTVIRGYSEMLLDCIGDREPLHANLVEEIQKAADLGAMLTWQLVSFGRKQTVAPMPLDLGRVVGNMEKLLRRLIGKGIDLVLELDPALGRVQADQGQLEQVLMNLVFNARDALSQNGRLTITTANVELDGTREPKAAPPGRYVMLAVTDNGCGMDLATQAQIFQPFFTTKEPGRGTGLGLSISRDIVQQHGGFIQIASKFGHGTTVQVYLPQIK